MEKIIAGLFLRGRPSSAPTPDPSHVRSQPVTTRALLSLIAETRLSAPVSPIHYPAPADPHRRRDSGQTVMRAFGQGCLMPPHPILSLLADDCRPYRHLTPAAPSPFRYSAVPSRHGRDAGARSLTARPHVSHPANRASVVKGVPSRPRRSPAGVCAWPLRCAGAPSRTTWTSPCPPFPAWLGQRCRDKTLSASSPCKSPAAIRLAARLRSRCPSTAER
jgi:hypothetical protein